MNMDIKSAEFWLKMSYNNTECTIQIRKPSTGKQLEISVTDNYGKSITIDESEVKNIIIDLISKDIENAVINRN